MEEEDVGCNRPRIKCGGCTVANALELGEKLMLNGVWGSVDIDNIWNSAASCIKEVVGEVLQVSRCTFGGPQGDWWWNGEDQGKIEANKIANVHLLESKDNRVKWINIKGIRW